MSPAALSGWKHDIQDQESPRPRIVAPLEDAWTSRQRCWFCCWTLPCCCRIAVARRNATCAPAVRLPVLIGMCSIERPLQALKACVDLIGFDCGWVTSAENLPDDRREFTNLIAQLPCPCGQARMIARRQSLRHVLLSLRTSDSNA
jgi:hypothetical protein